MAYLGLFLGARKTRSLGDFFIAGGSWGKLPAFLFNFSSALAGAEAVVVSAAAYRSGLSGIWLWWSQLFATPMYYLFSVVYKRARVFNMAEFFELRFGPGVATLYSVLGLLISVNFIGIFITGGGKVLAAITTLSVDSAVLICCTLVALYVATGGAMSSLLTDLFQGILCLVVLSFGLLPFLWKAAGGLDALAALPDATWSLQSVEIPWTYVIALLFSGAVGSVVAPNILTWIAIARDERTGTQCGWAHVWKRLITILFALYGILFAIYYPGLEDPELAWGTLMKSLLPAGVLGLLVASFAAALMSSVDTFATTTSGLVVDYLYRKRLFRDSLAALLHHPCPDLGVYRRLPGIRHHPLSGEHHSIHRVGLVADFLHLGSPLLRPRLETRQSPGALGRGDDRRPAVPVAQGVAGRPPSSTPSSSPRWLAPWSPGWSAFARLRKTRPCSTVSTPS